MARQARPVSDTGYYHIITRGIGRQLIFEDPYDHQYYLWLLEKHSADTGVTVCAYCLMQNHVHLLLFDRKGNIPLLMKKLGVSYSYYFNKRYERTGHLFQDRYKSEPVKDNSYLINVFKYILNNPSASGVGADESYPWSSYRLYGSKSSFVDTSVFCGILGSFENYAEFIASASEIPGSEGTPVRMNDREASDILLKVLGTRNGMVLQSFDYRERNAAILRLRAGGLSIRQIERLTGISRGAIQKIEW